MSLAADFPGMEAADVLTVEEIARLLQSEQERRASPRFPFQLTQRIAPVGVDEAPEREAFRRAMCKDVSMGGVSFYWAAPFGYPQIVVELGKETTRLLLRAEVLGSQPVVGLEPYHLVRCRFLERLSPASLSW